MLRLLALLLVHGVCLAAGGAFHAYVEFSRTLPDRLDRVLDYRPARASRVYSADGELIAEFFLTKRVVVPLERIPRHVQLAFLAAEDSRFFEHQGFDPVGIARAAWQNWVGGGVRQGASTITQQVTRMLMLSNERTVARKVRELILAVRVDRELSKGQILHIYLNHAYLGHGAYGVQAAAEEYFGKDVQHLTLAEAALLAGLPKAPTKISPFNDFPRARERQRYVLTRLVEDRHITVAEAEAARTEPVALVARDKPVGAVAAPYVVEHVRRWAWERFGGEKLFDSGLRIHTTIDMTRQRAAEAAVQRGLADLDARLGFRGPLGRLDGAERDAFAEGPPRPYVADATQTALYAGGALLPEVAYVGVVTELHAAPGRRQGVTVDVGPRTLALAPDDARRLLRWRARAERGAERGADPRRLNEGDLLPVMIIRDEKLGEIVRLAQSPDTQAALVALDPKHGDVVALVGGLSFARSQFNRATQARRQAGSSIKPFIYAAALERGYTPLSTVVDAPVAVRTASGVWTPGNYKNEFLGPMTLKTALAKSINTVSVRLALAVGVDAIVDKMRALGITTPIPRHISISLGTPDVSLLEMTAAYAAFSADGLRVTPRFVTHVTTDDGTLVADLRVPPTPRRAIAAATAYLVADLLRGVVQRGTAKRARELERPAAGKTGTSTGFRDAWFIGFTPDLTCGVWVGRDDFTPIGHDATGGQTSLPIWLAFMKDAHRGLPVRDFAPPPDITFVRADELTGAPAPAGARSASWVPFARGTIPPEFAARVEARRFSTSAGFE